MTFLGCVVAPLNLWYYHAQDLLTLENHLWVGGVLCSLMYIATVRVLRDPLFMYAVEVGVTLTVLLFLPVVNVTVDATTLSMTLMILALISVHAERAFSGGHAEFTRKEYGMPLFWSGQAQSAASLLILLGSQLLGLLKEPLINLTNFQIDFQGNPLTDKPMLAGCLWLVGAYLYLYSDLVVRRVGFYIYAAAFSLLMGVITLIGWQVENLEWIMIALSLIALGANIARSKWSEQNPKFAHIATTLGVILSGIPLLIGAHSITVQWHSLDSTGRNWRDVCRFHAGCRGL